MKKISYGTAAVAGALLCALALAGCQGKSGSTSGGTGSTTVTVSGAAVAVTSSAPSGGASQSTATGGSNPGDGVPSATPTGATAVDSELDTVDQQLGAAGTDLAQATASPSDGG
jgi:ABC-type oligopeptide transport system substrate-binding subunit